MVDMERKPMSANADHGVVDASCTCMDCPMREKEEYTMHCTMVSHQPRPMCSAFHTLVTSSCTTPYTK